MPKLLTIAIPTYNRALKLDKQLAWLDRNIVGLEHLCEVVISDNASTDITPAICTRWQAKLSARGVDFRINRNGKNLGALPNIACCIELATSRFSWVIGDDDEIPEEKLVWVVARLDADPNLASIVLNFEGVGKSVYDRCFHHPTDLVGEGQDVMGECLKQAYFGLAFMTAQIYRTEYAQAALRAWPEGTSNYDYQVFLTAYAGLHGKVLATSDTHCKYVTGDNVYERNKRVGLMLYADSLQVFLKLRSIGYTQSLCRQIALRHVWQLKRRLIKNAFQCSPLFTLYTLARTLSYLVQLIGPSGASQGRTAAAPATAVATLSGTQVAH